MQLTQPFEQPRPICDFLSRLSEIPPHTWFYIPASVTRIASDTPCYATTFDSRDFSPEELDDFDALVEQRGLLCFFNRDQLEDIRGNLRLQRTEYSFEQLLAAIDFYWRHNAFIDLSKS